MSADAGPVPDRVLPPWQEARRRRILAAARDLLLDRRYDEIQISDVITAAEVARGTLYRYFTTKDHLYASVVREWSAQMGGRLLPDAPAPERIRLQLEVFADLCATHPHFVEVQQIMAASTDPDARAVVAEYDQAGKRWLAEELSDLGSAEQAETWAAMLWALTGAVARDIALGTAVSSDILRVGGQFLDLLPDPGGPCAR